jgi:thymidylate synthase ThyX
MNRGEWQAQLTPSTETLSSEETAMCALFFTNPDRSVVALTNLPEVIKGALFSRYSRSAKGVRRLFLDEFFVRDDLGIEDFGRTADRLRAEVSRGAQKAEAFYQRILSEYGDDSVGELGGAHLACQEISQIAARVIEDNRVGLSYLEKSSRYVPFDDRVNGQFRYYRPTRIMQSAHGSEYVAVIDGLFESYARHLPRMTEHLSARSPLETIEFENARTGEVARFDAIRDETMRKSAQFAYRQAVRARACDVLRYFLPMATLTNVGVWGNGRALEYLLVKMQAEPLEEVQALAQAAHSELSQVIGPFLKRAGDEKGQATQAFLQHMRAQQRELVQQNLGPGVPPSTADKATLVRYDLDALDRIVAAILYPASEWPKAEISSQVSLLDEGRKAEIVRAYVGERLNRRHKPGRAFERAMYEFDLLLNIGEFRDLQRHRMVSGERQAFTTVHGFDVNDDIRAVEAVQADYMQMMERAARLYERLQNDLPVEAPYVIPFGYRVRYNVQVNLREAYHWIELRSAPQGHPDYRRTSQDMYYAIRAVHPTLVEPMRFVDLTPDVPFGRLRAEMRRASRQS